MSANPAYAMGLLCVVGGITGFVRTRSVPSLVAGVSVGLLYFRSASALNVATRSGLGLGASALLFLSSAPRAVKGPVPAVLTVTSALAAIYYGNAYFRR